ncbi:hypothetical protein LXL04_005352 [Taraxacum kok-saghyz]
MNCDLQIPSFITLPNLKTLHLSLITFPDDDLTQKLFAGCLALEELVLLDCEWTNLKNVMISSSNLKRLTIDDLPYFGPPDDPGGSKITIDTPNLVLLKYTGFYENILHCWCPIELFHDLQQAAPSPDDPGGCKITIDTPNLVLLKYTGYLSNEILLCWILGFKFYENIIHCWCPIELFHDLQQAAPSPSGNVYSHVIKHSSASASPHQLQRQRHKSASF